MGQRVFEFDGTDEGLKTRMPIQAMTLTPQLSFFRALGFCLFGEVFFFFWWGGGGGGGDFSDFGVQGPGYSGNKKLRGLSCCLQVWGLGCIGAYVTGIGVCWVH